ncbi:unnamed protein product [Polarella glacialis]|uniref:Uncharacterized protein n=1 Tax=Polarella glacialis TaxID=89957 RepID=A0A813GA62_POLGL|nr:unnamed protein product [Polarella glacialis]CAE8680070.1 unnamed protein product [Polarella glacialis]
MLSHRIGDAGNDGEDALSIELQVFNVRSAAVSIGPMALLIPGTDASAGVLVRTAPSVKIRLVKLLGLRANRLKFARDKEVRPLLSFRRWPLAPPALALFSPDFDLDRQFTDNCLSFFAASGDHERNCSGRALMRLSGAKPLSSNDILGNLAMLQNVCDKGNGKRSGTSSRRGGYSAICPRCNQQRRMPGRRPSLAWRCSACSGDSQNLLTIRRLLLAKGFGDDVSASKSLRPMLWHALKAGHAEAVHLIVGSLRPSVFELNLALKARRASLLASMLGSCDADAVGGALLVAERDPRNQWGSSGVFNFPLIRRRLSLVRVSLQGQCEGDDISAAWRCGVLCILRRGLPAPARERVRAFLPASLEVQACLALEELLEWTQYLKICG